MNDFRKQIAKRMRSIRRAKEISQESIAFDLGRKSQSYISEIENGKANISVDRLGKILKLLNITPKEFFDF
jgi:transcriptional regulator with XRE-family HTH domain